MADGRPICVSGNQADFDERVARAKRDNPQLTDRFIRAILRSSDEITAGQFSTYEFGTTATEDLAAVSRERDLLIAKLRNVANGIDTRPGRVIARELLARLAC